MVTVQPSKNMGQGLFATQPWQPGQSLFENPLTFSLQHTPNRRLNTVCACCLKYLGGLGTQLETMFGSEDQFQPMLCEVAEHTHKWEVEAGIGGAGGINGTNGTNMVTSCVCGERYCSPACQRAHWAHSHELLCLGNASILGTNVSAEKSALMQFKLHAIEHCDTLLLALTVYAHLVQRVRGQMEGGGGASSGSSSAPALPGGWASSPGSASAAMVPLSVVDGVGCSTSNGTTHRTHQDPAEVLKQLALELMAYVKDDFVKACRPPPRGVKDDNFINFTLNEVLKPAFSLLKNHFATVLSQPSFSAAGPVAQTELERIFGVLFSETDGFSFFSKLLGMFELNNLGVELDSPLESLKIVVERIAHKGSEGEKAAMRALLRERYVVMSCLWDEDMTGEYDLDEEDEEDGSDEMEDDEAIECAPCMEGGVFGAVGQSELAQVRAEAEAMTLEQLFAATTWPKLMGTAFSPKIARSNHSCTPNAKFFFEKGDFTLVCKALKPIQPGEEIFLSYIRDEDPVEKRRKTLKEYGFFCNCERCVAESSGANGGKGAVGGA